MFQFKKKTIIILSLVLIFGGVFWNGEKIELIGVAKAYTLQGVSWSIGANRSALQVQAGFQEGEQTIAMITRPGAYTRDQDNSTTFYIKSGSSCDTDKYVCEMRGEDKHFEWGFSDVPEIVGRDAESSCSFNLPIGLGSYQYTLCNSKGPSKESGTTKTVKVSQCNISFNQSCTNAYDFGSTGGTSRQMCGSTTGGIEGSILGSNDQFFKITIPSGKKCDLKWTLTPENCFDSSGRGTDYDLYAKWSVNDDFEPGCVSRTNYQERSTNSNYSGLPESLSKNQLPSGTYYAMAHRLPPDQNSARACLYTVTASLTNCTNDTGSISPVPTINFTSNYSHVIYWNSGVKLTWSATNAFYCIASITSGGTKNPGAAAAWSGEKPTYGSVQIEAIAETVFTLKCVGNGEATKSIKVTVPAQYVEGDKNIEGTNVVGETPISTQQTTTQTTTEQTTTTETQTTTETTTETTEQTTTEAETPTCDSTSYNSFNSSLDLTPIGSKDKLCGKEQYFKISLTDTCDLKWTVQPDTNVDYDIYSQQNTTKGILSRFNYENVSNDSTKGKKDEISKTQLSPGTYYAMAYKEQGEGNYSITSSISNCQGLTADPNQALIDKINQLKLQIQLLQQQLGITTTSWCHTFTKILNYQDRGYEVGALQAALQKGGLYSGAIGGYSAYFGDLTKASAIAFQEKYKDEILTPLGFTNGTGVVGQATIAKLNQLYGCK